ncbi:lysylphosphatidylglycerol synthase transmembrane domain-containing protein [Aquilutibacter rugosus]|uniref:lysylphosphatidylglycerol synthase transmembrane domain-containing protein n=1 Tax=Aquilutibacter rugosus TaxID=3115820 RepID=UPI002F3F4D70
MNSISGKPPKLRYALVAFLVITALYVGVLFWLDAKRGLFVGLSSLAAPIAGAMALALVSFFVRYLRWRYLLALEGYTFPFGQGFLAYLSGFAFTATPGKVGELYRIHQFLRFGVPASQTFAAFLLERACDLVVVLLLSLLCISGSRWLGIALFFVGGIVSAVVLLAFSPALFTRLIDSIPLPSRLESIARSLVSGFAAVRVWLSPSVLGVSLIYGFVAWSLTSLAFVLIVRSIGVEVQFFELFGAYPLAMLVGAASMIPGGVGTTETALAALLHGWGVGTSLAVLAAVAIRFSTMWFSILLGLTSIFALSSSAK